ncbi:MAG TPA: hypothetical protein VEV39_03055 [Gemmatimonadales bacterium]|nr:hypothetical protein [Gemmatimonadales bacterium]
MRVTLHRSSLRLTATAVVLGLVAACSHPVPYGVPVPATDMSRVHPNPDPREGLKAGLWNAGEAAWNLRVVSHTHSPDSVFLHSTNSDLAFTGNYVIQGNYNGYQVWDITNPAAPTLKTKEACPASQSDVSVYKNLLFVSGEGNGGRLDCGAEGVKDTVSKERLRGLRIFDISDISAPKYIANVQTCRGSHTHTMLADPKDPDNVYIYISGSAPVRSPNELAGCSGKQPDQDSTTALFRIEVIKVPLAHPEQAAIVSSPRIFHDLTAPPTHGLSQADKDALDAARAKGAFIADIMGNQMVLPNRFTQPMLDSIVKARGGSGAATGADSAALRAAIPDLIARMIGRRQQRQGNGPPPGPTQCHDITVYAQVGWAGGACEGYGLLLNIQDPAHPFRVAAVDDSNFSYWHSATFNNDGTKVLFSDEWGGGGGPKCRKKDPKEWGADAIFTIGSNALTFQSYYKMPAIQTEQENCVAHNGSLIPIPGRDVMVQSWYQGGVSVFDWTDAAHPQEIAFFDYGPVDSTQLVGGGTWSAYWYNGVIVSSEIARGLDIFALQPSGFISQNEIDAAKSVHFAEWNTQGQRKFVWPASFALSGAYVDQLERSGGLSAARIATVREGLKKAEGQSGTSRQGMLTLLATQLQGDAAGSSDANKVNMLIQSVKDLAAK